MGFRVFRGRLVHLYGAKGSFKGFHYNKSFSIML